MQHLILNGAYSNSGLVGPCPTKDALIKHRRTGFFSDNSALAREGLSCLPLGNLGVNGITLLFF
ncbi:MAG: hypothetical protein N0E37_18065, partial [Candidatus Thiodiazotropha taylori]|nr:hypothetical protein [Candidatus Thiodiazotropha taylori]MCW4246349.1 hypothetical protein [Candidatus Thiodiazotropha taylori]